MENINLILFYSNSLRILNEKEMYVAVCHWCMYLPPGHNSSDTCFFPIGFHVNMPSGKMGYLITETKFDRNFSLGDSRNIEESFSL